MPIRTAITRQTGQGEQMVVDCCQWNPVTGAIVHESVEEMQWLTNEMLKLSDTRLYEMNMRMLEAYAFEKYFTPDVWYRVISILDVLAGRVDPQQVIKRWEDSKEETEELERGRLQAMQNGAVRTEAVAQTEITEHNGNYVAQCGCSVYEDGSIKLCETHV